MTALSCKIAVQIQHGTIPIIFPLVCQTVTTAQTSIGREKVQLAKTDPKTDQPVMWLVKRRSHDGCTCTINSHRKSFDYSVPLRTRALTICSTARCVNDESLPRDPFNLQQQLTPRRRENKKKPLVKALTQELKRNSNSAEKNNFGFLGPVAWALLYILAD